MFCLKYVGIDNFVALINNTQFHQAMRNILLFVFVGLLTQLPIGFFFAILLDNRPVKLCRQQFIVRQHPLIYY